MKVAISCDTILERDYSTRVLEAMIEIFPEAEIYTLAHRPGAVIGPVEQRKIHSSYMSHLMKGPLDFWKYSFLIPSAAKKLVIPCSFDLIINISTGFSQGIKRCQKTKQVTYLIDEEYRRRDSSLWHEKFFSSYLKKWALQSFKQVDSIWKYSDLRPFIKMDDYPLFPAGMREQMPMDTYLIEAQGLGMSEACELVESFQERLLKFKFVGADEQLSELKERLGIEFFFGERCSGELAPLLAGCRAYVNLRPAFFPERAAACLATGRPVILADQLHLKELFQGAACSFVESYASLFRRVEQLECETQGPDAQKVRAEALPFHDLKFKAEVKRRVAKLL